MVFSIKQQCFSSYTTAIYNYNHVFLMSIKNCGTSSRQVPFCDYIRHKPSFHHQVFFLKIFETDCQKTGDSLDEMKCRSRRVVPVETTTYKNKHLIVRAAVIKKTNPFFFWPIRLENPVELWLQNTFLCYYNDLVNITQTAQWI